MHANAKLSLRSWKTAWHNFRQSLSPPCGYSGCAGGRNPWRSLREGSRAVRMRGAQYCDAECLQRALVEELGREPATSRAGATVAHRIPLGLLLLSRQQLTTGQLRIALEAQRKQGAGDSQDHTKKKIGVWLQELGFVTEPEITAALARQWSCPVLRTATMPISASHFPPIPMLLLESFQMMPVGFAAATGTLLMAFGEGIDYTVLYAIEQMLRHRTDTCLVCPSTLQKSLQAMVRSGRARDVIFHRRQNASECARIIGNYSAKVGAEEVRLARCGEHLWIRLERLRQEAVTLVLRLSSASSQFPFLNSQTSIRS